MSANERRLIRLLVPTNESSSSLSDEILEHLRLLIDLVPQRVEPISSEHPLDVTLKSRDDLIASLQSISSSVELPSSHGRPGCRLERDELVGEGSELILTSCEGSREASSNEGGSSLGLKADDGAGGSVKVGLERVEIHASENSSGLSLESDDGGSCRSEESISN